MKAYKHVNNIVGWIVFAIAAFTYCSTVEPSASFWDCPEFISTAYKLEVGHAPGAPFFMLTGNFFSQFTSDPAKVALMVNIMSALLSAFCILFLFWTITHLARKIFSPSGEVENLGQLVAVIGAGIVGALAYAWSDTFWFSAEEGEVYAYSSMFTALVFWLILKWEDHADEPGSDRWLVLIFYLTGLSIGVHLLNLLCLPAIALVYYFRKSPRAGTKQAVCALLVGMLLVAAVLYGVVPGIVKVGGWFELFFVNVLGLPFNTGVVIYLLVLVAVVLCAIWSTTKSDRTLANVLYLCSVALLGIPFIGKGFKALALGAIVIVALTILLFYTKKDGEYLLRKRVLNTSLLCMLMLMIGYSSYAVTVIRSTANTPMDQNSPEDIFSLGSYLSRDQYGYTPLFRGQAYSSMVKYDENGQPVYITNTMQHRVEKASAEESDSYEAVEERIGVEYAPETQMLFPRMHSRAHTKAYQQWLGDGLETYNVDVEMPDGRLYPAEMPTQLSNLRFFLSYQVNFMYWRYFLWNFAGRQNGLQGFGEKDHGNWITGIKPVDQYVLGLGDIDQMPDEIKNEKGHNAFFLLPLLLGLIGLFWQAFSSERGIRQFWVVFFLFFMTGLAIVLYLNQTPQQPRERDYAYAGSFYAFAIWIGLGVCAIAAFLKKLLGNKEKMAVPAGIIASLLGILVPLQMVSQTWDDHDRSGRYACRDFGLNYLNTMPKTLADGSPANPIIFTNGDNDTFPLWYNQETEGRRTDARVCNLQYLNTEWYTDQMVRPAYDSPSLPIAWKRIEYVDDGKHSMFPIHDEKAKLDALKAKDPSVDPYDLRYIIDNYVRRADGSGYLPTDSVVLYVNKENVINQGMLLPGDDPASIPEKISLSFKWANGYLDRSQMMIYEMLARNEWKRPIYMSVTLGYDNYAGLHDYCILEGLAYRLTPFKRGQSTIDTDRMYDNVMNNFKWGNVKMPGIYLDETNMRMSQTHRHLLSLLTRNLIEQGKTDKALNVLNKMKAELPDANVRYDVSDVELVDFWNKVGKPDEANRVAGEITRQAKQYIAWANTLSDPTLVSESLARYGLALFQLEQMRGQAELPDNLDTATPEGQQQYNNTLIPRFDSLTQTLSTTPAGRIAAEAAMGR